MAFARTNPRSGSFGDLNMLAGDWTGSEGDATGTVTLKGGRVYLVNFTIQDGGSQEDSPVGYSVSITSGTITISVFNHVAVTQGRFIIIYA